MISIMSSVIPCNVRKRHVVISGHVLSLLKEIAEALFTREGGSKTSLLLALSAFKVGAGLLRLL